MVATSESHLCGPWHNESAFPDRLGTCEPISIRFHSWCLTRRKLRKAFRFGLQKNFCFVALCVQPAAVSVLQHHPAKTACIGLSSVHFGRGDKLQALDPDLRTGPHSEPHKAESALCINDPNHQKTSAIQKIKKKLRKTLPEF